MRSLLPTLWVALGLAGLIAREGWSGWRVSGREDFNGAAAASREARCAG